MAHIKVSKGLDIPIKGKPEGHAKQLIASGTASVFVPSEISLNLKSFDDCKFKLLVKVGDVVKIGQPLAEDKASEGRMFVSPAGGIIKEIRRGHKRTLLDIVVKLDKTEQCQELSPLHIETASPADILERLKVGGAFSRIRSRPLNMLAKPEKRPRAIFVKAIESALFTPPSEFQVINNEKEFQTGLDALSKLTDGAVHLVYRKNCTFKPFIEAENVQHHTAEGPHPTGTFSVHIQAIDPIRSVEDIVWTINAHDVVVIGHLMMHGRYWIDRVIGIGGPGIVPTTVGYFKIREGFPISSLLEGRIKKGSVRLISGDPLTGTQVEEEDFIGFDHYVFCAIPENTHREFLHFFRLGTDKYSFSHAYFTGHLDNSKREYDFSTNQHGQHRAFIDSTLYDKVQPLKIPTMLLVKAVMAEDFDRAEELGLLEVDSEDFALPTFVCPSKMEMVDIMKHGIKQYAKELTQ